MNKNVHELRDPIHVFIRATSEERKIVDSRPFQRLRHIHQLALTYLVYPGATHRRFEHSLGVMEVAGRIFDVLTQEDHVSDVVRDQLPEVRDRDNIHYWRRVLRVAALIHDIGHLPFSHAAEHELLPEGWDHERLTIDLVRSDEMASLWSGLTGPLRPEDIVKLAVGPKKLGSQIFSRWELLLAEIITGDAFGADRIDYLLRDSHHTGVAYGRFDHHRLIDTLRILPYSSAGGDPEPTIGIEQGGIQSVEALLLARYFMFSQLYLHRVRRIYDIHLKDFLQAWLPGGRFSTATEDLLAMTDNEVLAGMTQSARLPSSPGHGAARRIACREHFRLLYERSPQDISIENAWPGKVVHEAAVERFGAESLRYDRIPPKGSVPDFPVLMQDGRIFSSTAISATLPRLPIASVEFVFVDPNLKREAERWLRDNRDAIIQHRGEVPENE